MKRQFGYLNVTMLIIVALLFMVSYWLIATPKADIFQTVRDLPNLTMQKLVSPKTNQDSQVNQKPVVDAKAAAKLSTQSIQNNSDLDKMGKDVDSTDVDGIDKSINQIDTDIQ